MTKKHKITIGGTAPAGAVVVDFGGSKTKGSIAGAWKTTEGRAVIHQKGTKAQGAYGNDNGELAGEMNYPQRFEGFWAEPKVSKPGTNSAIMTMGGKKI